MELTASVPVDMPVEVGFRAVETVNVGSIEAVIRSRALLAPEALARAILVQAETGEPLEAVVTRLGLLSEQALAEALADATGLTLIDAGSFPAAPVDGKPLNAPFLHDVRALPISIGDGRVKVAFGNPFDRFAAEALGFAFGARVEPVLALPTDIEAAVDRLYRGQQADAIFDDVADLDDLERLKDLVSDAPVIRAVNRLIADAVERRASDIHVEPTDDRLAVRLRIDGVLQEAPALPAAMRTTLVSRIKVMAGLNIAERRLPQDGRLRVAVRGHEIDLRVATAPSIHGESIVMRILDRSNLALDFASLGFDEGLAGELRGLLHRPHGIVLVTGPTGSGKTTTLYAALAELNSSERKVLTVEDPIEYRLPGIVQTQVNPGIGLSFGSALRSFLRQDPDVMMVGEIRDLETAQIAVQAALTGHMILSTLHTNSAAGAVTRLMDMEVEPFLLTSTLSGVLAQRLARRLCPDCREPYLPSEQVLASIGEAPAHAGPFYRAVGCEACGQTGYRGRIALIELLVVDEAIARLVLQRADARDIERAARAGSMRSLMHDGLLKANAGLTTIEEVLRVATDG